MKVILLSGASSGKRLWPLSNDIRSKQFLKVLPSRSGEPISRLQRVWGQLQRTGLSQAAYVCSARWQYEIIRSQIDEVPVILEPVKKDTFASIALSALYLKDVEKAWLCETMIVMPVDPYVEDDFFTGIAKIEKILRQSKARLALVGTNPTFPSEKYGYIVTDFNDNDEEWEKVNLFVEKPSKEGALKYIQQGTYWNCGIFCMTIDFMLQEIKKEDCRHPIKSFLIPLIHYKQKVLIMR